MSNQHSTMYHC